MKKFLIGLVGLLLIIIVVLYRPTISKEKLEKKYGSPYSKFLMIDGMNAHYHERGNGRPLLLIHGTSSSLHTWGKWEELLSANFKVFSIDMPGGGLTGPHPNQDYSIEAYISYLEKFCNKLGLDSIYIAGNSLGGKTAWKYASQSPRVKKLILIDPSGFKNADKKPPLVMRLGKNKFLSSFVEKLNVKPFIRLSLKDVYYDDTKVTRALINRYTDFIRLKGNRKAFFQKVSSDEPSEISELHHIKCPTLIQWGKEDPWIAISLSEIYSKNIANNKLIIYDHCGHVPQEELPEISAKDASLFLLSE